MNKIGYTITLFFFFLVYCSCEEYEMVDYGEGGEINFMGDYYRGERAKPWWVDEVKYLSYEKNLGINPLGDSLMMDTVVLGVKIMGMTTSYDRKVVLKVNPPKQHALEVIFPEEYVVPADTGMATFRVVMKRPPVRDTVYTTEVIFDYDRSDFKRGTEERQVFKLEARDEVSMELWKVTEEEWYVEDDESPALFLGDYSNTKARFIITLLNCPDFSKWYNSEEFWEVIMSNLLYDALEEYKSNADNPPLLDENTGEWIKFPNMYE